MVQTESSSLKAEIDSVYIINIKVNEIESVYTSDYIYETPKKKRER